MLNTLSVFFICLSVVFVVAMICSTIETCVKNRKIDSVLSKMVLDNERKIKESEEKMKESGEKLEECRATYEIDMNKLRKYRDDGDNGPY